MNWTDEGIVLGVRRHGEANAILEVMTVEHGRHLGLVRGGSGSRMRPVLQPGNAVRVEWRARLDEHLGHFTVEAVRLRTADLMAAAHAVYGVTHLAALCRLLPERDPHAELHETLSAILDHLDDRAVAAVLIARFELRMLTELGFGLDLDQCAATGATADLIYVSPKSGRAVSRVAGEPWRDRMLHLPAFLREGNRMPETDELAQAFALTGFFLARHVLEPRGLAMHDARASFINAVMRVDARAAS
jgi:DNA repair protein RecO (recombination protein O)